MCNSKRKTFKIVSNCNLFPVTLNNTTKELGACTPHCNNCASGAPWQWAHSCKGSKGRTLQGSPQKQAGKLMRVPSELLWLKIFAVLSWRGAAGSLLAVTLGNSERLHWVSPLVWVWTFIMYVFSDEFPGQLIWLRIKISSKYHKELSLKNEVCSRSGVISKGMFSLVKIRKEKKHSECKLLQRVYRYVH